MKCGLRMTLVLPGSNGCHGWGTRDVFPHRAASLPILPRVCDGVSPLPLPLCTTEGEELSPRSSKPGASPPLLFHPGRQNPSPEPPAAGAGWKEQQTPKMCHCAKCFQILQDVTVSQFQFIRRRREDAVTSKLSFSL